VELGTGKAMAARDLKSLAWRWPELNDMLWRREVKGGGGAMGARNWRGEWRICHLTCNMH